MEGRVCRLIKTADMSLGVKKDGLIVTSTTRLFIGLGANLTPDGFATPQAGCEAAMVMLGDLGVKCHQDVSLV